MSRLGLLLLCREPLGYRHCKGIIRVSHPFTACSEETLYWSLVQESGSVLGEAWDMGGL